MNLWFFTIDIKNDISGSGANGAIIHYTPEAESCSVVDPNKLFLLDSGAQYVDGTTDITRTVHFGEPTAREKECFTRVLKVLHHFSSILLVAKENYVFVKLRFRVTRMPKFSVRSFRIFGNIG